MEGSKAPWSFGTMVQDCWKQLTRDTAQKDYLRLKDGEETVKIVKKNPSKENMAVTRKMRGAIARGVKEALATNLGAKQHKTRKVSRESSLTKRKQTMRLT